MDNLAGPDMLIDTYDQYTQQDNEVVDITPDDASEDQGEATLRADDFESMKKHVLPDLEDLEVEHETYHTWEIRNWQQIPKREHGPTFHCGDVPWRVLFFPFGNSVDCASFYLEHGYENDPPADWYACVQFSLVLWNPATPTIYKIHQANHRFTAKDGDWGFTRFVELRKAFGSNYEGHDRPLIENDGANMTAYVRIIKDPTGVLWHNFENYDSKKITGMVGLKNQGATCYLNSLLQSLYFTGSFRKAVYQIPTDEDATKTNSAYTLQRLFYRLQKDKNAVSTNELTGSFGWDTRQIFEQQDVQELSRILMDKLETRMKGTAADNALAKLFVGKSKTYIDCINVNYESSRIEDFWDLQLNVRGNRNLDESFKDYIQVETLDGENKYDAGPPHGLQDAKKGVIFEEFPPVLHLQLKRFEYDINRDAMMKVNDRHEFPDQIDLTPYLSPDAKKSEPWDYQLHGVLVHSGDFNAGHYYAFLKPAKDGFFYRFDDDRVTRATMKEVLEDNYGGEYPASMNGIAQRQPYTRGTSTKRSMNAYMLVYIRKSRLDQVLPGVKDDDVPSHIERRITEEKAELERRKKEREEAHLYIALGVLSDKSFKQHHWFDLTNYDADQKDPAAVTVHRVLRQKKVGEFAAEIAEELGVDSDQVRFWVMVGRQNKTNRPDQPLKNDSTIDDAWHRHSSKGKPFYLWAETRERDKGTGKVEWPDASGDAVNKNGGNHPILVFLKYFDINQQTLSGMGHVYVNKNDRVDTLFPYIRETMGWSDGRDISLYEEIKFSMIETMKSTNTFGQSEIQDGDIICFQENERNSTVGTDHVLYANARMYYDYLLNKIPVMFQPRIQPGEVFTLDLSKKMTYEQFSEKVGQHLQVPATHLRFATVNSSNGKPKAVVKRNLQQNLYQILQTQFTAYGAYSQHRNDCLYYEVLEVSLQDYETKKLMKPIWLHEGIVKEEQIEVLVPKTGIIGDLINGIMRKLKMPEDTDPRRIRVLEVAAGKISRQLPSDFNVGVISEFTALYAEFIPDEEINADDNDRDIYCYHFDKDPTKPHGIPFILLVKPGETFKDTKERLSKRTGIKGKLFQNLKFALVPKGPYQTKHLRYLEDEHVLADVMGDDDSLGLDHVNKAKSFWGRQEGMFIK
ncbi:ubiquitin-specific protease ubp15 [Knufia obscura]|uniref:ubiquitinyl hydrolase 1 n=2 Tax=Knufia TaxID=430999 RepID=A0AAN8EKK9_9EURO|nr:ubiquitin-specific protease ubp15 [Knufia obscura]KAK5953558.1 ubiquitin-specific protease ubp15 [Knufia fluminis]